jgi:hypothetical protein
MPLCPLWRAWPLMVRMMREDLFIKADGLIERTSKLQESL